MAEVAGKIVIELNLLDKGFTMKMQTASGVVREFTRHVTTAPAAIRRMERGINGIIPRLRDLFVTISMIKSAFHNLYAATFGWQMKLIKTNAEIERMTFLLRGMSKATTDFGKDAEAAGDLSFLFNMAETTPFSLTELTSSFVKFRSVGLEPTDGSLRALSDALASFGGNEIALHRATIAIQQMAGKGVISMEELRQQLGEHVPNAIGTMARGVGMSYQELVDKVSKGQVVAKDALMRTFDEMRRSVGGASQRMMTTWSGIVSILETRWTKFQLKIGEQGFYDKAKRMLGELVDGFDPHAIEYWGQVIGKAMTSFIQKLSGTLNWIAKHRQAIADTAKGAAALFVVYKGFSILAHMKISFMALAAATQVSTTATVGLTAAQLKLVASSRLAAGALGIAQGATTRLGLATTAAGGPFFILLGTLAAISTGLYLFSGRARSAYDDIKELGLAVGETQQKMAEAHLDDLRRRRAAAAANSGDLINFSKKQRDRMAAEVAALNTEIAEVERVLIASSQGLTQRNVDRALIEVDRDIAFAISKHNSAYTTAMLEFEKQLQDGVITNSEFRAEQIRLATIQTAAIVQTYSEMMAEIQNKIASDTGENIAKLNAQLGALFKARNEFIIQADAEMERLMTPTRLVDGITGSKGGISKLQSYLNTLGSNIADVRAEMAGMNGEVAKFRYMLESGAFKEDGAALLGDPERLAQINAQIAQLEELRKRLAEIRKMEREGEQAQERLRTMSERTTAAVGALRGSIDSRGEDAESRAFTVFKRDLDELISKLPEATREAEATQKAIADLIYDMSAEPSLKFADDLRDQTSEVRRGLMSTRAALEAEYQDQVAHATRKANLIALQGEDRIRVETELNAYLLALADKHARDMENPLITLARSWEDATERMKQASTSWMESLADHLTDLVTTGKMNFRDFAESVIKDIIRIRMQEALSGILSSMFGGGGFNLSGVKGVNLFSQQDRMLRAQTAGFANGGIMTPAGALPLHAYATGGIARRPQMALFGEGRTPEAYVPLPDGRTIPVTMNGGANVQVNVINQSGTPVDAQSSPPRFDGRQMVLDVVLKAAGEPGPFRDSMRGALK